ncbi:hypothetical protein HDV63DRAFT_386197 [Trichoderma sp. SZMC 28014]
MPSQSTIAPAPDGLRLLWEYLGLATEQPTPDSLDVVIVSIDFENASGLVQFTEDSSHLQSQLGVAMLDTRNLSSASPLPPEAVISTHNFVTGPRRYYTAAAAKFLFGTTLKTSINGLISQLESLISRARKIVLVGHAISNELRVLQHFNFDLRTSIIGIFDTMIIASEAIPSSSLCSLGHLLKKLHCPFSDLHSAGNDAHFTLRCLLLLATKSYINTAAFIDTNQRKLDVLENIAYPKFPKK